MAITALALPLDIPWRRLSVSRDMVDTKVCDREFPLRWRSSVAIFEYEPPEEDQTIEGSVITYLKVVCTVTGFQPDGREIRISRRGTGAWTSTQVTDNMAEQLGAYYPCFGALLEVSVGPESKNVPVDNYPYFADFEPKKRELYEVVTETGEVMSRSLEDVGVRLGKTTASSHEVYDKQNFAQEVSGGYGYVSGKTSYGDEWGSKDVSSQQYDNVRTTDSAREQRETLSHTTQLTQMYHQLSSYHLGTNRAVFFVLPRPHVVDAEKTFVNGPRRLEGIQEFFLVVVSPKAIGSLCIEAYLETAHLGQIPKFDYDPQTTTLVLPRIDAPVNDDSDHWYDSDDDSYQNRQTDTATYSVPPGWEVDTTNGPGWTEGKHNASGTTSYSVEVKPDHVTLFGEAIGRMVDNATGNDLFNASLDMSINIFIKKKTGRLIGTTDTLFLTGRGSCTCGNDLFLEEVGDHFTFEVPMPQRREPATPGRGRVSILDANVMRERIGDAIIGSLASPARYPRGAVDIRSSQLLADTAAALIRTPDHPDNRPLSDLDGLDRDVTGRITAVSPGISRGRLLQIPLTDQIERFGLDLQQAADLRRQLLGILPVGERDEPQRVAPSTVPDLTGLRLDEVRSALHAARLGLGNAEQRDDEQPSGVVLAQSPEPGTDVGPGSKIDVVTSTGLIVRLPDLVGMGLGEACCRLRDAGLRSEPELDIHTREEGPLAVSAMEPPPGHYVTPHSRVIVRVGR